MESSFYDQKVPALALFVGLLLTFLILRLNTRLIRRGVHWWPRNIHRGGLHIHHMVLGLPVLFVAGLIEFAVQPENPWAWILALIFGGAAAMVFDEYALVLHLKDVYWEREGRLSVVAIFIGVTLTAFLVIGLVPLDPYPLSFENQSRMAVVIFMVVNLAMVAVNFLKGKLLLGWIGFFVPFVAFFGAIRLGQPGSPWARWFYRRKPARLDRAQRRAESFDKRWGHMRRRVMDLIAGAPNK
jgi:lysyl-tRNA synthetase, class II